MTNKGFGLPGVMLGVLAGSAVTSLIFWFRSKAGDYIPPARDEAAAEYAEPHSEQKVNQQSPNDTSRQQCTDSFSNGHHRHTSSLSTSLDGQHRVSFAIDEEEECSFSSKTNYTGMIIPTAGTNCHVIAHSDWETHAAVIQAKTFEEKYLSKIDNKNDLEIALRRTLAVNTLAQSLTAAEDEKTCLEIASTMLVPLFKIDACAYLLKKVRNNAFINRFA